MLWFQRRSRGAYEAEISFQISALTGVCLNRGPCSLMSANVTTRLRRNPSLNYVDNKLCRLIRAMTRSLNSKMTRPDVIATHDKDSSSKQQHRPTNDSRKPKGLYTLKVA